MTPNQRDSDFKTLSLTIRIFQERYFINSSVFATHANKSDSKAKGSENVQGFRAGWVTAWFVSYLSSTDI